MLAAGRSLTEPPGLNHSALPYSSTPLRPASNFRRRISGVLPIKSSTVDARLSPVSVVCTPINYDRKGPNYNSLHHRAVGVAHFDRRAELLLERRTDPAAVANRHHHELVGHEI